MPFRINHIHLKSPDPRKTAEWYEKAFAFKIVGDETRVFGDRFIRCQSEDGGMAVNISGARTNEKLGAGDANPHHGLEHFGFDSEHLETDIARLEKLGAKLLEGPIQNPNGPRIAFMRAPDDCRVELIERRAIAGGAGSESAPATPGGCGC
jgi:lactoylglutathione lyase